MNFDIIIQKKNLWLSTIIGVCISLSITNHYFADKPCPPSVRIISTLCIAVFLSCVIILLHRKMVQKTTNNGSAAHIKFFLNTTMICWLFFIAFPIDVPLPPQWHTLEITASGEMNEKAKSNQVTVMNIQDANEEKVYLGSLQRTDGWIEDGGLLITETDRPETLTYRFRHLENTTQEIMFYTGPESGIVDIRLDNFSKSLDLYEQSDGIRLYNVPVTYSRYFYLILYYAADILSITFLIYLLWFYVLPPSVIQFFKNKVRMILLLIITMASVHLIHQAYAYHASQGYAIDVSGYIMLADKMTHPFDTGIREPLWIWLVKLFHSIPGEYGNGVQYLGIILFLMTSFMLYRLVLDIFQNKYLAIITLALYALNPFIIDIAVQGLRDVMNQLTIVGMTYFVFVPREKVSSKQRISGLTIFFFLAIGTTISNMIAYSIMLLFAFLKNGLPMKYISFPLLLVSCIMGPYMVYCQRIYHDAFYAANAHAIYWRNYEFVTMKQTGCQGCPTPVQLEKSAYAGESTSTMKYLFGLHEFPDLVLGTIQGYITLFFSPSKKFFNFVGVSDISWYYIYLIGLIMYARRYIRHGLILLIPFLITNVMAYMIFMSGRLFSANAPFICLITSMGLFALFELIQYTNHRLAQLLSKSPVFRYP